MASIHVPDFMLDAAPRQLPIHPLSAPTTETGSRWAATRFRRRLVEGLWYQDLYLWAQQERHPALLLGMGNLDVSESLYTSVTQQLAVVYEEEPVVRCATAAEVDAVAVGELFGSHGQLNRSVLAYGEAAIVLEQAGAGNDAEVTTSLVLPDEMDATPLYYGSRRLGTFRRATFRALPGRDEEQPCWDCWDVRDPAAPRYELRDQGGRVVSSETGNAYPWRYETGAPFIPAVLYHAEPGNRLWSPWRWPELARATLENAMNWSDWREALRNASFLVRYLLDADIDGAVGQGDGEEASEQIPIAPNVLLRLRSRGSNPGSAGVLSAPVDILRHAQAIVTRQKVRATHIGLYPSEVEIGGGPESGTALTIRREGQRREQRRQIPLFRRGDLELLKKWAACRRIASPSLTLPEEGWSVTYPALPLTEAESRSLREAERHDLMYGLTSRAAILARRHNLSPVEGEAMAAQIRAQLATEGATPSPTAPAPTLPTTPDTTAAPAGIVTPATVGEALPLEPAPPRPDEPEHPYSGRLDYQGLPILVETAAGETRSGTDPDGRPWSVVMPWHYGEIEGTLGLDGDPIDVMVGPDATAADVFILHLSRPGEVACDEDKAYLGFADEEAALAAFRAAYTRTDILQGVTRWRFGDFAAWVLDPDKRGVRMDAPPGSGLPEREPEAQQEDPDEDEGATS